MSNHPADFNNLPEKVDAIFNKLSRIEKMIKESPRMNVEPEDRTLTIKEASELTKLAITTIYSLNYFGKIPCWKQPGGKRLYFSSKALIFWLKNGRPTKREFNKLRRK